MREASRSEHLTIDVFKENEVRNCGETKKVIEFMQIFMGYNYRKF